GARAVCGRPCLEQVMRDLRRPELGGRGVDELQRVRDGEMQALAPRYGKACQQRLPYQLMTEGVKDLATSFLRHDDAGAFGFIEDVEERVGVDVRDALQQPELEPAPDHGCGGEHLLGVGSQALDAPAHDQAHTLGHVKFADCNGGTKRSAVVEYLALFDEVSEHLVDEEGVA